FLPLLLLFRSIRVPFSLHQTPEVLPISCTPACLSLLFLVPIQSFSHLDSIQPRTVSDPVCNFVLPSLFNLFACLSLSLQSPSLRSSSPPPKPGTILSFRGLVSK